MVIFMVAPLSLTKSKESFSIYVIQCRYNVTGFILGLYIPFFLCQVDEADVMLASFVDVGPDSDTSPD